MASERKAHHKRSGGIDGFSDWEIKTICQSYKNGATKQELRKRFHTSDKSINKILDANGIETRKQSRTVKTRSKLDYSELPKTTISKPTGGRRRRGRNY